VWRLDIDQAEFYLGLMDDYLRHHPKDVGVMDDRRTLSQAILEATEEFDL
jgi:hypothetical protein